MCLEGAGVYRSVVSGLLFGRTPDPHDHHSMALFSCCVQLDPWHRCPFIWDSCVGLAVL